MKKTYKFAFSPLIIVLASVINVLLVVVIVLNTLKLTGIGTFDTVNVPLDVAAICIAILLIAVVDIFLGASSYTLYDEYLLYSLGFFRYKIYYKNMLVIREEKTTHALVVNYQKFVRDKDGNSTPTLAGLVVNINNAKKDEFVGDIREKNTKVLYELIDKNIEI